MGDESQYSALTRNAMIQLAMERLTNGDFLRFKQTVQDINTVALGGNFLVGLLSAEASKLWCSDDSYEVGETSICIASTPGDVVIHRKWFGYHRLRSNENSSAKSLGDQFWRRWLPSDRDYGNGDFRANADFESAVLIESVPASNAGSVLRLFVAPGKTIVICAARDGTTATWKPLWRTEIIHEEHADGSYPRSLWASDGTVFVVLRSREAITLDLSNGRQIARSLPLPNLLRVLDFASPQGALAEWVRGTANGRPAEVELGRLDIEGLKYRRISARYRHFDHGEVLAGVWHGKDILLVARGEAGCLVSRTEGYIWAPTAVTGPKDALHRNLQRECDARLAGQFFDPDFSFGRSVLVARVATTASIDSHHDAQVVLNTDHKEALFWSGIKGERESDKRRVLGLRLGLQPPNAIRRPIDGPLWIAADGATAFLAANWGFDAIDLRTLDPIGGFDFSYGEIRTTPDQLTEDSEISQCDDWSDPVWEPSVLEPDGYPRPDKVWYSEASRMVIATWRARPRNHSIGLSLDDGCLYGFSHPGFSWISTDANGRSLFLAKKGVYEIRFGKVSAVRCVRQDHRLNGRLPWGLDDAILFADGAASTASYEALLAYARPRFSSVLAVSTATSAWLFEDKEGRHCVVTQKSGGSLRAIELEPGSEAFPSILRRQPGEAWAFTPDGLHLVARTESRLSFWCVETGRVACEIPAAQTEFAAAGICFSPCASQLVVVASDFIETWGGGQAETLEASTDEIRRLRADCFGRINQIRATSGVSAACMFAQQGIPEEMSASVVPAVQRGIYAVRKGWLDHVVPLSDRPASSWF